MRNCPATLERGSVPPQPERKPGRPRHVAKREVSFGHDVLRSADPDTGQRHGACQTEARLGEPVGLQPLAAQDVVAGLLIALQCAHVGNDRGLGDATAGDPHLPCDTVGSADRVVRRRHEPQPLANAVSEIPIPRDVPGAGQAGRRWAGCRRLAQSCRRRGIGSLESQIAVRRGAERHDDSSSQEHVSPARVSDHVHDYTGCTHPVP
jgi:hypothetical protein